MSSFLTLLKYELKMQFSFKKKKNFDFVGQITSLLISLFIIVIFVFLITQVVTNYVDVRIDKLFDPISRGLELLNVFYTLIIIAMSALGVEKMRKVLSNKKDKAIFLRLPVNSQTIFLSKLTVLLITSYVTSLALIIPVNIIFFIALKNSLTIWYWFRTIIVCIFLPLVPFLISSLLIIPYIKIIDFIKNKYLLVFILLTIALVGAFIAYSKVLEVIQILLETGNIKFLFNEKFITTVQKIFEITYPANSLANIALGENMVISILIVIVISMITGIVTYFITKNLFYVTLYKNETRVMSSKKKGSFKELNPVFAFIKKEFITVFREPAHVFSYFAIACAMPVMVYSCFTMFQSLLLNTIGIKIEFPLALLVILIFSVLTNTFCATNISRDGLGILKTKALPISAGKIVLSKVMFCSIVSSLAVFASGILLVIATNLTFINGLVCVILGILFSLSQIFIATKLDLNHAKVSLSPDEVEKESSKTVAKVISVGLVIALIIGIGTILMAIFVSSATKGLRIMPFMVYVYPMLLATIYFVCSFFYCKFRIEKKFNNLVM